MNNDFERTFERSAKKEAEKYATFKSFKKNFEDVSEKPNIKILKSFFGIIGFVISIILSFVAVMNLTIILKSYIKPNEVPSFLGVKLFIVETDSMKPVFSGGDIIFVKKVEPKNLQEGDVISYSDSRSIVTHRIMGIDTIDSELSFITKGDANNTEDISPISEENVEGIYWFKVEGIGKFAMYMQSPQGRLIFVGIPVLIFIIYDILKRKERQRKTNIANKKTDRQIKKLEEELKRREK